MSALPKSIASVLDVPPPVRALYEYGGGDYYTLNAGGHHLRVIREIAMAEKEEYGRSYEPPLGVFQKRLANQKLPAIPLRDWTITIGAAIPSERATLLRLLAAGAIKIVR